MKIKIKIRLLSIAAGLLILPFCTHDGSLSAAGGLSNKLLSQDSQNIHAPCDPPPQTASDLYNIEKVRRVDIGFSEEGWRSLQADPLTYVKGWISIDSKRLDNVGIRQKGNSTLHGRQIKLSFKIDTDRFIEGQTFFGLTKLNLHHPFKDPSWMREAIYYGIITAYENHIYIPCIVGYGVQYRRRARFI